MLVTEFSDYAGQPVAIVIAGTSLAEKARDYLCVCVCGLLRSLLLFLYGILSVDTQQNANMIAGVAAAGVKYESAGKPILTIQEAIAAGSFFDPEASVLQVGDAKCNLLYPKYTG